MRTKRRTKKYLIIRSWEFHGIRIALNLWDLYPEYDVRPVLTSSLYYNEMDRECKKLCDAINKIDPNIVTRESCSGHGKGTFSIWFYPRKRIIKRNPKLQFKKLIKYLDKNWTFEQIPNRWIMQLSTETKGPKAYELAEELADKITKDLL